VTSRIEEGAERGRGVGNRIGPRNAEDVKAVRASLFAECVLEAVRCQKSRLA
jgi:hypothetical protein